MIITFVQDAISLQYFVIDVYIANFTPPSLQASVYTLFLGTIYNLLALLYKG